MVELKINIPENFYNEEIRNEYVVSESMKKVWAVELDLLNEFKRVCEKYNLNYYADSGTLIGAIRHKGFIPWDDDIDLVMRRDDYEKLKKIAMKEFKNPYFFQTTYTDVDYIRGHAQLRNSNTTGYIMADIDKPFNRGIFIDIFPMDNVPDSRFLRKIFFAKIKILWKFLYEYYYDGNDKHSFWGRLFGNMCSFFYKKVDYRKVFHRYELLCRKYNSKKAKNISYVAYSKGKEKHIWEKKWFDKTEKRAFEFMDIDIPSGYDERLKKEYNDYMVIKNIPTSHGGVVLDADKSYLEDSVN